jgi:hypothetical protein
MLSDKIEIGKSFLIETPKFKVDHYKFYVSNLPSEINIDNASSFKLPSFCDLKNNYDCLNNNILLKVNFYKT